ncbi:unnamed protein product [Brassica rapa]|uniref:Uncharacterized protein n=2 Tax=Brassica TaxID=3705 RepID=A0A8D9M0A1_BRACM|nr:unnamed protein product [Brassica napus]CAG7893483.1 unnamed protein product [Brassica rapa]
MDPISPNLKHRKRIWLYGLHISGALTCPLMAFTLLWIEGSSTSFNLSRFVSLQ